ncbi:hypothetical protein DAI22_05g115600 [Oryza sativa Japonica Group]|nr:hypothetical protein DAI22_05g115600 [Oryza sativa Japonica Group]
MSPPTTRTRHRGRISGPNLAVRPNSRPAADLVPLDPASVVHSLAADGISSPESLSLLPHQPPPCSASPQHRQQQSSLKFNICVFPFLLRKLIQSSFRSFKLSDHVWTM